MLHHDLLQEALLTPAGSLFALQRQRLLYAAETYSC